MDTPGHELTKTYYCKAPGCENEARSPVGAYAYCDEHRTRPGPRGARHSNGGEGTMASKLASLRAQANKVDRLRAKAAKLTAEALKAKNDADAAQRAFRHDLAELTDAAGIDE